MKDYIEILQNGGIGIIATDTIYGIVGQALRRKTVDRIYNVKKRTPTKPFIILISKIADLEKFSIHLTEFSKSAVERYWPGPVSIILDCTNPDLEYLHRGTNSLAFRMPADESLQSLISRSGPLVAPSANPEGLTPAQTIDEAKSYFGNSVDFYVEGTVSSKPSRIIKITNDSEEIIRP
ncbi:L-threonylcarbamoyladenylate synthase [soil metagenome]